MLTDPEGRQLKGETQMGWESSILPLTPLVRWENGDPQKQRAKKHSQGRKVPFKGAQPRPLSEVLACLGHSRPVQAEPTSFLWD